MREFLKNHPKLAKALKVATLAFFFMPVTAAAKTADAFKVWMGVLPKHSYKKYEDVNKVQEDLAHTLLLYESDNLTPASAGLGGNVRAYTGYVPGLRSPSPIHEWYKKNYLETRLEVPPIPLFSGNGSTNYMSGLLYAKEDGKFIVTHFHSTGLAFLITDDNTQAVPVELPDGNKVLQLSGGNVVGNYKLWYMLGAAYAAFSEFIARDRPENFNLDRLNAAQKVYREYSLWLQKRDDVDPLEQIGAPKKWLYTSKLNKYIHSHHGNRHEAKLEPLVLQNVFSIAEKVAASGALNTPIPVKPARVGKENIK